MTRTRSKAPIEVLTLVEAAAMLRIAVVTAKRLARAGDLPGAVKIGDQWRVNRATLERHLNGEDT